MAENLLDDDSPRAIAPNSEYARDEAGTAPGDRAFRPDIEGLRAVAILTVILYHANVPPFTGGYIGVDVFFVISGFVITGVLLRERSATGGTITPPLLRPTSPSDSSRRCPCHLRHGSSLLCLHRFRQWQRYSE